MLDVILKRFEEPDETRAMTKGRFDIIRLGGVTVGRATCEPGWRWSLHVGPALGERTCTRGGVLLASLAPGTGRSPFIRPASRPGE